MMEHHLKMNLILLMLVMTVLGVKDCIRRYLLDEWYVACTTRGNRYIIIHRCGTAQEKQTLVSHAGDAIFPVNYTGNYTIVNESPLASRTGPPAALYYNFDTLTGLGLMAGSGATNYDPFGPGKINKAVVTDPALNQWLDLGVLSETCITVPDTCGPEDAAISVWVKIHSCDDGDGILSSLKSASSRTTGFMFFCYAGYVRNYLAVRQRRLWPDVPKTIDQWIPLAFNFIGPNGGEGVQAFKDGILRAHHHWGWSGTQTDGDGQVVVGRRYVSRNEDYAHVEVDELVFFNEALSNEEVGQLYDMYQ